MTSASPAARHLHNSAESCCRLNSKAGPGLFYRICSGRACRWARWAQGQEVKGEEVRRKELRRKPRGARYGRRKPRHGWSVGPLDLGRGGMFSLITACRSICVIASLLPMWPCSRQSSQSVSQSVTPRRRNIPYTHARLHMRPRQTVLAQPALALPSEEVRPGGLFVINLVP